MANWNDFFYSIYFIALERFIELLFIVIIRYHTIWMHSSIIIDIGYALELSEYPLWLGFACLFEYISWEKNSFKNIFALSKKQCKIEKNNFRSYSILSRQMYIKISNDLNVSAEYNLCFENIHINNPLSVFFFKSNIPFTDTERHQ